MSKTDGRAVNCGASNSTRLAVWASKRRDLLPIQARVARHIAAAEREGDWKSVGELRAEWDGRQIVLSGIGQEIEVYCRAH